jgi:hypothetical protein
MAHSKLTTRTWSALPAGIALAATLLASATAHAGTLTYTITSPLKSTPPGFCPAADTDGDCLDDAMESALANWVSPYYFWDENDECNYYSTIDSDPNAGSSSGRAHDEPRYYFQVRPIYYNNPPAGYPNNVSQWTADGWYHWIRITYFLNYPRDCGTPGHQGDNESVAYDLFSADLTTWGIGSGYYNRHNEPIPGVVVNGDFLYSYATGAGGYYPMVMADDHGHGSWEGNAPQNDYCGIDTQGHLFDWNYYCFVGNTAIEARQNGNYVFPTTDKNIGEPTTAGLDGHWNRNVLSVNVLANGTELASSGETTGDYVVNGVAQPVYEFWSDPSYSTSDRGKFCGWQCPSRWSDGNCQSSIHGKTDCTMALFSKIDNRQFYR